MPSLPDRLLDHPGLLVLGLLAAGLVALWLARRVRRIVGVIVLALILLAVLPGPRSAGVAAAGLGSWSAGAECLKAAAREPGIWRSALRADALPACEKAPGAHESGRSAGHHAGASAGG